MKRPQSLDHQSLLISGDNWRYLNRALTLCCKLNLNLAHRNPGKLINSNLMVAIQNWSNFSLKTNHFQQICITWARRIWFTVSLKQWPRKWYWTLLRIHCDRALPFYIWKIQLKYVVQDNSIIFKILNATNTLNYNQTIRRKTNDSNNYQEDPPNLF